MSLLKDSSGLGLTIAGLEHQGLEGLVVSSIIPNGPADKSKQIRIGDRILEVLANCIGRAGLTIQTILSKLTWLTEWSGLTILF